MIFIVSFLYKLLQKETVWQFGRTCVRKTRDFSPSHASNGRTLTVYSLPHLPNFYFFFFRTLMLLKLLNDVFWRKDSKKICFKILNQSIFHVYFVHDQSCTNGSFRFRCWEMKFSTDTSKCNLSLPCLLISSSDMSAFDLYVIAINFRQILP